MLCSTAKPPGDPKLALAQGCTFNTGNKCLFGHFTAHREMFMMIIYQVCWVNIKQKHNYKEYYETFWSFSLEKKKNVKIIVNKYILKYIIAKLEMNNLIKFIVW